MHVTPPPGRFLGHHAIVIGASMSGLLAARVLSTHFDRVTVFDRDRLPDSVDWRAGVPQGRHGHGLLASGLGGLERLFPGFERTLVAGGAVPGDVIGNVRWFQHGYYKAKFTSGLNGVLMSRPLLETTLRRHVQQLPNVRIFADRHVMNLLTRNGRVTGVLTQERGEDPIECAADLVVDASGRSSPSPAWLEELGYGKPPVDEVVVDIGYTTRTFKRLPGELDGDAGVVLAPTPPRQGRLGFMMAMEGDRWMATLGGWLGDHAPRDAHGFVEFSKTLGRPDIYDVIKQAEPLTDAVKYVFPSNLRRRYERFKKFPKNFLVIGDAMCSFNPIYGQGMSVATLEALALEDCLQQASSPKDLWRPFFKLAGRLIETPWMIAAGSDFAFPGVTGSRPAGVGLVNRYLSHIHRCASTDRVVCRTFFDVANLLKPAPTLFKPSIVARVLRDRFRPRPPERARPMDSERHRLLESH
jgi:2-polyprenyl-6-methoxyphenol hydroxylase-like FAD-dependent oxidoreductase